MLTDRLGVCAADGSERVGKDLLMTLLAVLDKDWVGLQAGVGFLGW